MEGRRGVEGSAWVMGGKGGEDGEGRKREVRL